MSHLSFITSSVNQIGDFLWIAVDSTGEELVLDVVVERKRMDDLAQSITGGRLII